jgi:hypothetical protein
VLKVATASSPQPTDFAAKAKDLQALRDAVADAAGVGSGLWLSYLFVSLYLALAAGEVTHRDLFFQNPVNGAKTAIADLLKVKPEVNSLACFRAYRPRGNPQYWALYEKTAAAGLRRAGFPDE